MTQRVFTCVICPNSCTIKAEYDDHEEIVISGNKCSRGREYVLTELKNPVRTVTTSIPIENGDIPLCSVKLTKAIPKSAIMNVVNEIRKQHLRAPVHIGEVVVHNVCGYDSDVVITKNIDEAL